MPARDRTQAVETRRIAWVRRSQVPPIDSGPAILERKGVVAPMDPTAPPFLLLGEDRFVRGAFPMHPHEGIETVTYVVTGNVEHEDSLGNRSLVQSGGVQWMTAGRGIRHSEEAVGDTPVHGFQLWIDLPTRFKQAPPSVQTAERDRQARLVMPGGVAHIAAGRINDITGPIETLHPATMAVLDLEPGADLHLDLDPEQAVLLFVRTGAATLLGTPVAADHGAYLQPGPGALAVRASTSTQMLLYAAVPSV